MDKTLLRWRRAQEAERNFWLDIAGDSRQVKEMAEKKREVSLIFRKMCPAIFNLKEAKILEIGVGPLALGLIRFIEDGDRFLKIGLEPLKKIDCLYGPKILPPNYFPIQARGEELPFSDSCFSLVIIDNVIDHCHNPLRVLEEAGRVIEEGGFLFISINLFSFIGALKWELYRKILNREAFKVICHPHSFTGSKMRYCLNQCDFKLQSIYPERKSAILDKIKEVISKSRRTYFTAKKHR